MALESTLAPEVRLPAGAAITVSASTLAPVTDWVTVAFMSAFWAEASPLLAADSVTTVTPSPIEPVPLMVVVARVSPCIDCSEVRSSRLLITAPERPLPVEMVLSVVGPVWSTTFRVCWLKMSPSWTWVLLTVVGGGGVWLVAAPAHVIVAAIVPTRRIFARTPIVGPRVSVSRVVVAGDARGGERIAARIEADLRPRRAVEVGHHLQRRALDHRAHGQLDRL